MDTRGLQDQVGFQSPNYLHMKVTQFYKQELAKRGYGSDAAQQGAIDRLQRCQDEWLSYKEIRSGKISKMMRFPDLPRGVYMWGGVGRLSLIHI